MSEYTPEDPEIKAAFLSGKRGGNDFQNSREFENWLRKVREDAWDEGEDAGLLRADFEYGVIGYQHVKGNPYRKGQS